MSFLKKISFLLIVIVFFSFNSKEETITIKVKNTLKKERSNETVVLTKEFLKIQDLSTLGIRDKKSGEIQITQTVDLDGDGVMDELLFQPKIGAKSKKKYIVFQIAENQRPKTETYCYSRFVPERTDDYAWENNKVAFRTYGPRAQKMIEDNIQGGTLSSGIDAWLKRVEYPIINKWYDKMTTGKGTYHEDTGEGLDNFHVGSSRGIGGTAVKIDSVYYISKNFISWKTITTGPIRTSFILTYADWDAAGNTIQETKKISLDYGNFLSKFEISLLGTKELSTGLTLHDKKGVVNSNFKEGWLDHWETVDDSEIGTGSVVPNKNLIEIENYLTSKPDLSNHYATLKVVDNKAIYYAGFGWKKQGTFTSKEAWESYLSEFAEKVNNPLVVSLKK
ncbi:MAG: DUF4861 domain-containing protein [Flavobacterium sp.]|nr:DUF4861 domain-containing protein [Flavobacterium sp.]